MHTEQTCVFEMGYTQQEFESVLNSGFTNQRSPYRCQAESDSDWLVTHQHNPFQVLISLKPLPPRRLGAIALPVLSVQFTVLQNSAFQSDNFFDKFFKYFHKGGG